MKKMIRLGIIAVLATFIMTTSLQAAGSCKNVRFSDVGWTDITATTALTSVVLEGLGYTARDSGACRTRNLRQLEKRRYRCFPWIVDANHEGGCQIIQGKWVGGGLETQPERSEVHAGRSTLCL